MTRGTQITLNQIGLFSQKGGKKLYARKRKTKRREYTKRYLSILFRFKRNCEIATSPDPTVLKRAYSGTENH